MGTKAQFAKKAAGTTRFFLILFVVLLLAGASALTVLHGIINPHLSKSQIIHLVTQNQDMLTAYIDKGDFAIPPSIKGIESVKASADGNAVDFNCGGVGIVPSGTDFGFYYMPAATDAYFDNMTPKGKGYLDYQTGNTVYYEHICGCFYYYEWHY